MQKKRAANIVSANICDSSVSRLNRTVDEKTRGARGASSPTVLVQSNLLQCHQRAKLFQIHADGDDIFFSPSLSLCASVTTVVIKLSKVFEARNCSTHPPRIRAIRFSVLRKSFESFSGLPRTVERARIVSG